MLVRPDSILGIMAEKENCAFRLYRLFEKMLAQPQNISTAQVLLNVMGAGDVKAGRPQSRLLSHISSLISDELDVLVEETDQLGFTDKSRQSVVAAVEKLSVWAINQQWQQN